MKITDVHVDGFGIWTDLSIGSISQSLTVFYGPNEAGKTTLMEFIRTVLYGFSSDRRAKYLPPVRGTTSGGSLGVQTLSGRYRIERSAPRRSPDNPVRAEGQLLDSRTGLSGLHDDEVGEVALVASDGSMQRGAVLGNLLSNLDERVFTNVFAIGLRELQELATLNDTEAAQQLYKLSSGVDRVSLVDVMATLEASRTGLLSRDERPGQIAKLLAQRERLRADIDQRSGVARRWGRLAAERVEVESESQRLQQRIAEIEQESRAVEIAMQVRDRWLRRQWVVQQIEAIDVHPNVGPGSLSKLDRTDRVIAEREKSIEAIREQRQKLREAVAELPWNKTLWTQRDRIAALAEHASWIESLQTHIDSLQPEIDKLAAEWKQACQQMGISPQAARTGIHSIDRRTLMALRGPARAARDASRRLKQLQLESDAACKQLEELTKQLDQQLAENGFEQIGGAIEQSGDLAAKLRRRIQVEERLEKLNRVRKELDEDCIDLMKNPIMPLRQMAVWGTLVSVGVMLTLVAIFSNIVGQHQIPFILFGAMCTGGGFLLKHAYQKVNNQELEECQRQLAAVKKHIKQTTDEREEIEKDLPQGGGQLDSRLKKAEDDLKKMESLAPLAEHKNLALARVEETEKRAEHASNELRQARMRWKNALRKFKLPEDLTPRKIKQLAEGNQRIADIEHRLSAKRQDKEERLRELETLSERIAQALRDVGLEPETDDPRLQLKQMAEAVSDQQRVRERRAVLRKQDRDQRRNRDRGLRSIEKLRLRRQALFSRAGVDDEAEFREIVDEQKQRSQLEQEQRSLDDQIRLAIGMHCSQDRVEAELESGVDLQHRWNALLEQVREGHASVARLNQHLGEIQQELRAQASDHTLAEAHLELACIDEQISQSKSRWKLLATTGLVLESIRRVYETERQPETLNEASKFLRQLTLNRYQRVWTPLGESTLRVDDATGKALSVELLSQGTRESVFLSLRLALVAAYARRGAALPLVLDDVMVNLDTSRAAAAAKVLHAFADAGHQILLFTCHEHIASLFTSLGADMRELPRHESSGVALLSLNTEPEQVDISAADQSHDFEEAPELHAITADDDVSSEAEIEAQQQVASMNEETDSGAEVVVNEADPTEIEPARRPRRQVERPRERVPRQRPVRRRRRRPPTTNIQSAPMWWES